MNEHYNNLTLKTLSMLKYFIDSSNFITPPKYLVKVDDDTFVNVPRLWNTLNYDENWSSIKGNNCKTFNLYVSKFYILTVSNFHFYTFKKL